MASCHEKIDIIRFPAWTCLPRGSWTQNPSSSRNLGKVAETLEHAKSVKPRQNSTLSPSLRKDSKTWNEAGILPKGSLLRMSNSAWLECTGYSPSSMTKSINKGQTVGEKHSGILFLQAPSRIQTSGSLLQSTPGPHKNLKGTQELKNYLQELPPRTTLQNYPWELPSGKNGKLPIRSTFHISGYGRIPLTWTTSNRLKDNYIRRL